MLRLLGLITVSVLAALVWVGAAGAQQYTTPVSAGAFTQVAVGRATVCALRTDQTLFCWGSNSYGQAVPPAGTFKQVSSGDSDACAIRTDDSLVCWGYDGVDHLTAPPAGSFTSVSAGFDHNCAVRSDQTLVCWGEPASRIALTPAGTFLAVSAQNGNDCAIRTDHTPVCWGHNTWGEGSPPAVAFAHIATNFSFSCAIKTDANAVCWGLDSGLNGYGQTHPPAGTYAAIGTSASNFACGLRTDAQLACWGNATAGLNAPPAGNYTDLSVGTFFACAVRVDQRVTCWGSGVPQGPADPTPTPTASPTPTPTSSPRPVTTPAPPATTVPVGRPTPTPTAVPEPTASQAFSLPSAKRCVSRRRFTIRIRRVPHVTFVSAVVTVNGKRVKTVKRSRITAPVNLTGLPKGRFKVTISARTSTGQTIRGTRVYRTCTPRKRASSHSKV